MTYTLDQLAHDTGRDDIANYGEAVQTLARLITLRFQSGEVGFTIDWEGRDVNPRNAYSIGGVVPSLNFPAFTNTEEGTLAIAQWLAENWGHKSYAPIGAWLDTDDTGIVYFDLVTILPIDSGFKNAVAIGKARGELAIGEFDCHGCYVETHSLKGN